MAGLGSLVVELSANTARFEAAMNRAQHVATNNTRQIVREVQGMRSSFDAIPGSIAKIAAAAGGLTAIAMVFKKAIAAADEFKLTTIGIAAGLTNIAKPGQGDFKDIFKRNLAYAEEMARKLEEVAAKSPAEPAEMMMAYNQLVQQGYAARLDEAEALGLVVTRIKLATVGQDQNKQINQELRALMQGQAVAGSMLAQELESRLGPGWADIVNQHRKSGDLLKYLASLWPGINEAGNAFEQTLQAQGTTLVGHLKYLGREGLGGLYDDLVSAAKTLNDYLRDHGKELAANIVTGWNAVKEIAGGVVLVFSEIVGWIKAGASYLSGWVSSLNAIAKQRADLGVGMGLDVMPGVGGTGLEVNQAGVLAQVSRNNLAAVNSSLKIAEETQKKLLVAQGPPEVQTPPGKGAKGGGKGGADTVQKELEKLAKEVDKARKDAYAAENDAFNMIWKLKQDTAAMYAEATKGQYEIKGIYKASYDTLGSITPLMRDQTAYQKKALELEIEIEKYTLETKINELDINKAQADQLRGLQALTAQAKKFNAEMEADKGIRGWAFGRAKEAEGRNTIKDMMGGLETGFQGAFASGLQGVLSQEKKTLKDIGKTMFQGLLGEIAKGSITRLFDSAAKVLRPTPPGALGVAGTTGDVAGKLGVAAEGLQVASEGFGLNTVQFGLAAGGLLLSGIGIAANSQALVYAGTVLQLAGLAIQLYEALTSTSTMASMGVAAGALVGAAGSLTAAAGALAAAAGSSSGGGIFSGAIGAITSIFGFHQGGLIRAHGGWPGLAADEVPIIAQTGERVLSRRQNRAYEAGGGGGGTVIHYAPVVSALDARGVDKVLEKHGRAMMKGINEKLRLRGRKL